MAKLEHLKKKKNTENVFARTVLYKNKTREPMLPCFKLDDSDSNRE